MSRLIGAREEGIIVNAARLSNLPIRRIMLPAEYISTLNLNSELGDALIAAHHDMHTRFPVCEKDGDPQTIIGYVNFKDIVACMRISPHEPSIRAIVPKPAWTVTVRKPVGPFVDVTWTFGRWLGQATSSSWLVTPTSGGLRPL